MTEDIMVVSSKMQQRELTCQLRWVHKWHEPRVLQQAVRVTELEDGKPWDSYLIWQDVPDAAEGDL